MVSTCSPWSPGPVRTCSLARRGWMSRPVAGTRYSWTSRRYPSVWWRWMASRVMNKRSDSRTPVSREPDVSGGAVRGILLDLDGVLYVGDEAVPGAADAVAWLREQRVPHLFLTNTTSRPRDAIAGKLAARDRGPPGRHPDARGGCRGVAARIGPRAAGPVRPRRDRGRVRGAGPTAARRGGRRVRRGRRRPRTAMDVRHPEPCLPAADGRAAADPGGARDDPVLARTGRSSAGRRRLRASAGVRRRHDRGGARQAGPGVLRARRTYARRSRLRGGDGPRRRAGRRRGSAARRAVRRAGPHRQVPRCRPARRRRPAGRARLGRRPARLVVGGPRALTLLGPGGTLSGWRDLAGGGHSGSRRPWRAPPRLWAPGSPGRGSCRASESC